MIRKLTVINMTSTTMPLPFDIGGALVAGGRKDLEVEEKSIAFKELKAMEAKKAISLRDSATEKKVAEAVAKAKLAEETAKVEAKRKADMVKAEESKRAEQNKVKEEADRRASMLKKEEERKAAEKKAEEDALMAQLEAEEAAKK